MIRNQHLTLLSVCVAMTLIVAFGGSSTTTPTAPTATPSLTTFRFNGHVRDDSAARGSVPRLAAGTVFSGSYTFNPAAADGDSDPQVGLYSMPAPSGMTLTVAGVTLGASSGLRIRVRNNVGGVEDDYEVQPQPQADVRLRLFMRTRVITTLTSDALLLEPPDLTRYSDVHEPLIEVEDAQSTIFIGIIDRLSR